VARADKAGARRSHPRRSAWVLASTTLLVLGSAMVGCSDGTGVVELSWAIVDREGDAIYPGDQLSIDRRQDSCDLPGRIGDGVDVSYDLRVELEICDPLCEPGCDDPDCLVDGRRRFACDTARGSDPNVPAADHPYRFAVRAVVVRSDDGRECADLPAGCIDVPGPRERIVEAGLVTDLQVYQIRVGVDLGANESDPSARLDLEACGCG
jgi:hypothetical protein